MKAKQWFNLHAWAGLFVGVLLLVTCVSGTLATLSHEIEYLSDAKFRAIYSHSPTNFAAIEQTIAARYPGSQIIHVLRHKQAYLATEVSLKHNDAFLFVYLDGATGKWLGEGPWLRVSRFLRNWHMNLSLGWTGKLLVTSLAILLLLLVITSPLVYRQWLRYFFKKPSSLSLKNRSNWADWHKLLGLWSYWFIVVMALTGLWYLVEHGLQTAKVPHYVAPPAALKNMPQQSGRPISLGDVVNHAEAAFPSLQVRGVRYPSNVSKAIEVQGDNNDILLRLRANKVYLQPVTGSVLGVQKGQDLTLLHRIKDTADPLHFGNFAGLETKLIWAVFGALMSFICGAGLVMNWLRVKRKQPSLLKWFGVSGVALSALLIYSLAITWFSIQQRTVPAELIAPVL
uniref:PepSY-associated TM helix domain-containing protein n=1 Tax=Pseudoalteromonas mariniglutinosa TaxID=206042 RepID=UPI00387F46C8